jgi:hypothetical protein
MFFRLFAVLSLLVLGTACTTTEAVRLAEPPTANLSGKQVHLAREASPSFGAITAGNGMFGAVGIIAAYSEGDELVEQNGVQDPSLAIEQALIQHLRTRYQAGGPGRIIEFGEDKPADLGRWAQENNVRGLIIDVETLGWGFVYFPTVWSKYRVNYTAKVRLIDPQSKEVIAQYLCSGATPEDSDAAPSYDTLVDNRAAGLKAILNERARTCIEEVKTAIL